MGYQLIHGDCLEVMPTLGSGSVDAIICDPPYGTTNCSWDSVIPFHEHIIFNGKTYTKDEFYLHMARHEYSREEVDAIWNSGKRDGLWENYNRIIKPRGAIVMFGSQPFTSALVMSNMAWFRCAWVWQKNQTTGFLNAKKYPLKAHEDIVVFCKNAPNYYPIKSSGHQQKKTVKRSASEHYGAQATTEYCSTERYPNTILEFNTVGNLEFEHPTQKPVDLLAYLIRTYTNEDETILDNTMGSGSTIVAAIQEGRNAIGIERDADYFAIAQKRCLEATYQPSLFAPEPQQWQMAPMFGD